MASLFNAFLSDNESEADAPVAKPKKNNSAKPAAKSAAAAKSTPKDPQPVASGSSSRPANAGRKNANVLEPSAKPRNTEHRPRGRGRGAKHGDVDRRGKRVFDKQSGTGKDRGMKKGGGGGHNWGTELDTQAITNVSINETEKPEETETPEVAVEQVPEEPKEPEPQTFTMEDFMKKKAEKRAGTGFEDLKAAKVEGVKEGRQYEKNDNSEEVFMSMGNNNKKEKKSAKKVEKKTVEVGFKVRDTANEDRGYSSRGRGRGRGGFRGGRGSGGYRGRGRQGRVDVDTNNEQSFPTLGA